MIIDELFEFFRQTQKLELKLELTKPNNYNKQKTGGKTRL